MKGQRVYLDDERVTPEGWIRTYWPDEVIALLKTTTQPTLAQLVQLFGYTTTIAKPGENINGGGAIQRIGDEVLSPMWRRADANKSVGVRQLAAYHTQGNTAFIRYFTVNSSGTTQQTNLFTHEGVEGQSILPHISGSLTTPTVDSARSRR